VAALSRGIRIDSQTNYTNSSSQACIWRSIGGGTLNGWGRTGTANDAYATSYLLGGTGTYVYRFHGCAMAAMDFGGHTRNNSGAPLMDLCIASGCPYTFYTYYGKMTMVMNQCD